MLLFMCMITIAIDVNTKYIPPIYIFSSRFTKFSMLLTSWIPLTMTPLLLLKLTLTVSYVTY